MPNTLLGILAIVYMVLSYWAVGRTLYANKILIGTGMAIFCKKLTVGCVLGIVLIPVALIKTFMGR